MSIKDKIQPLMKNFWLVIFSLILVGSGCKSEEITVIEAPVSAEPLAEFSLTAVAFGEVPVLSTGNDQAIKVKNVGGGTMSLSDIGVVGDFSVASRCDEVLESGEFCYLIVGFAPTTSGALTGTLTVASNSGDSPKVIPLSGTGLSTALFVSPKAINFGEVTLSGTPPSEGGDRGGSEPEAKPAHAVITVKNIGSQKITGLKISSPVDLTGPFTQTNTCPDLLEAGATCFVTVTFIPTAVGDFADKFYISATATPTSVISLGGKAIEAVVTESTESDAGETLPGLSN